MVQTVKLIRSKGVGALSKTVRTYPTTETYDLEEALTTLGTGEAIVTVLSEKGAPTPVAWTMLRAPRSVMDTIGVDAIKTAAAASELQTKYGATIDRESAYEKLSAKVLVEQEAAPAPAPAPAPKAKEEKEDPGIVQEVLGNFAVKGFFRSAASAAGREITRSLFGTARRKR